MKRISVMNKKDVYVPSAMIPYQCGMSGRCCGGWDIGLDKESHDRLKFVMKKNNQLKLFKEVIKMPKKDDESRNHSYIQFQDGKCALVQDGLCSLHKNHGINVLPDICKVFPRLVYETPMGKELSITFACPNAAELLRTKVKITKVKNPENFHFAHGNLYYGTIDEGIFTRTDMLKYYFEIEDHIIEILQCRGLSIEERLVLLGITIKKIDALDASSAEGLHQLIQFNRDVMKQPELLKGEFKKINPSIQLQVFLLKEFINLRIPTVGDAELKELYKEIQKIFHFDLEDEELNKSIEFYIDQYWTKFEPMSEELSHVYENFLVFFTYRKIFSFFKFNEAYYLLIYFYALTRLMALGISIKENKPLDEDIAVKSIWTIEKSIYHSYKFYTGILFFLGDKGLATVSHGITLLKMPERSAVLK